MTDTAKWKQNALEESSRFEHRFEQTLVHVKVQLFVLINVIPDAWEQNQIEEPTIANIIAFKTDFWHCAGVPVAENTRVACNMAAAVHFSGFVSLQNCL